MITPSGGLCLQLSAVVKHNALICYRIAATRSFATSELCNLYAFAAGKVIKMCNLSREQEVMHYQNDYQGNTNLLTRIEPRLRLIKSINLSWKSLKPKQKEGVEVEGAEISTLKSVKRHKIYYKSLLCNIFSYSTT